jgi:glutaredoxin-related protein
MCGVHTGVNLNGLHLQFGVARFSNAVHPHPSAAALAFIAKQTKDSIMGRAILDEAHIHPAIRDRITVTHADIVDEVQAAIARYPVVVVGMAQNPFPRKARAALDAAGTPYKYLEYGSYLRGWRRRNALKMWSGWPTFPMVFVNGVLVGGASELQRLIDNGEFSRLLAGPPSAPGS